MHLLLVLYSLPLRLLKKLFLSAVEVVLELEVVQVQLPLVGIHVCRQLGARNRQLVVVVDPVAVEILRSAEPSLGSTRSRRRVVAAAPGRLRRRSGHCGPVPLRLSSELVIEAIDDATTVRRSNRAGRRTPEPGGEPAYLPRSRTSPSPLGAGPGAAFAASAALATWATGARMHGWACPALPSTRPRGSAWSTHVQLAWRRS
eukprot:scaffold7375_cov268-Pinguiococcus_pyrenoidosus.AAC.37